jgi:hypothetical protein
MKAIISFCVLFATILFSHNTFAVKANLNWEDDLSLFIEYNNQSDMIEAKAAILSETNQKDQFSL